LGSPVNYSNFKRFDFEKKRLAGSSGLSRRGLILKGNYNNRETLVGFECCLFIRKRLLLVQAGDLREGETKPVARGLGSDWLMLFL
jgi:hypothetical protein